MVLGAILGGAVVLACVGVIVLIRQGMFRTPDPADPDPADPDPAGSDSAGREPLDGAARAGRHGRPPRYRSRRFAAASERLVALPTELLPGIHQLLRQRQKIQAIKLVRERTGWSLREAKEAVDAIEVGQPPPAQSRWPVLSELPPDLANAVQELLIRRQKIQAIKLVRERTALSLRDAKEMVDGIQTGGPVIPTPTPPLWVAPRSQSQPAPPPPPSGHAGSLPPVYSSPPPVHTPAGAGLNGNDLATRARQLKLAGQEVRAVRLVRAETGMGITEATTFVRSLT
jgi:ribosomal protein L7/L12